MPNHTLDLTLRPAEGSYTLYASATPGGEQAPRPVAFPLDSTRLPRQRSEAAAWVKQARVALRRSGSEELRQAAEFGAALFGGLFAGETLGAYRASLARLSPDDRLLLRLRLPPELADLPWELLYDSAEQSFLSLDPRLALVRYLDLPQPLTPLAIDGPLQVVAVLASPQSPLYPPLRLDRELTRIRAALQPLVAQNRVQLDVIRGPRTLGQLRTRLRKPVHVLHLIGHGDLDPELGEGVVVFEDADGLAETVSAGLLREYLRTQRGQTRLVLLNACLGALPPIDADPFSSLGAALIQAGVPAVIAMQFELPDDVAADLAEVFYDELAAARPVEQALSQARLHIFGKFRHSLDWAVPVLFLRSPDGTLFQETGDARAQSAERRAQNGDTGAQSAERRAQNEDPRQQTRDSRQETSTPPPATQDPRPKTQDPRPKTRVAQGQPNDSVPAPPVALDADERRHLEELLAQTQARLRVLEQQLATFGLYVPAYIQIELDEARAVVARLQAQLGQAQPTAAPDPAPNLAAAALDPATADPAPAPQRVPQRLDPAALRVLKQRARTAYLTARQNGNWAAAIGLLEQVHVQDAADADVAQKLAEARRQQDLAQRYAHARELRDVGDWQELLRVLDELQQLQPDYPDRDGLHAWAEGQRRRDALYEQALAACDGEDWPTAVTVLEALLAAHPDDEQAPALLALAQSEIEQQEQARKRREAEERKQRAIQEQQQREAEEQARQQREAEERRQQEARLQQQREAEEQRQRQRFQAVDADLRAGRGEAAFAALEQLLQQAPAEQGAIERVAALAGLTGDWAKVAAPDPLLRNRAAMLLDQLDADSDRPGLDLTRADYWATRIEPGTFSMGDDHGNYNDEKPQFDYAIRQPYALARFPVTNRQYLVFVEALAGRDVKALVGQGAAEAVAAAQDLLKLMARHQQTPEQFRPRYWPEARYEPGKGNHPVVGVTWYAATAFAWWVDAWLRTLGRLAQGEAVRLPTEVEWERAAAYPPVLAGKDTRAGRREYPWGAWDAADSSAGSLGTSIRANIDASKIGATSVVGIFPHGAAACGAEELTGNVWEWCSTPKVSYPFKGEVRAESLYTEDKKASSSYVLRGGSWNLSRVHARCAYRFASTPVNDHRNFGLRLARLFSLRYF